MYAHFVSVFIARDTDVEVAGNSRAADDVLLCHIEMRGNRESRGPSGCGCQTQHTLHTQSLSQHLVDNT